MRSFTAGQTIFKEGEPGDELFVVLERMVSITVQEREVNRIEAGNIFGEMTLVDDRPRSATAKAFTDCKLLPLDFNRFLEIVAVALVLQLVLRNEFAFAIRVLQSQQLLTLQIN